jgi:uncharacterized protein (DUF927 family)
MGISTLENEPRFVLESFCEDFATTLNAIPDSYTEMAFAAPDSSAFNMAMYFSPIGTEDLYRAMEERRSVSFLNGCKKNQMLVQLNGIQKRMATNLVVTEKNILSFDTDCKDFVPNWLNFSPADKESQAKVFYQSFQKKIEDHNLPLWIALYSGNGFHFHFKTSMPIAVTPTYREFYLSILDYFQSILGVPFDPLCCNPGRLMRLPLSINRKDAKNPLQTQVLFHNSAADAANFLLPFWKKTQTPSHSTGRERQGLLEKLSLKEVLSFFSYGKFESLQETSNKILCSSPWTEDKTPSFYFCPTKKLFYDFSAGKGGDLFTLIAELAHIDCKKEFKTVLQYARKILGIPASSVQRPEVQGNYTLKDSGVWFREASEEGLEQGVWVCSYLEVIGYTRDAGNAAWGRLLRLRDADGNEKTWAMSMEYLAGDGLEMRKKLLHMGVQLNLSRYARHHLPTYLLSMQPTERLRCVARIGWMGENFLFPDQVYSRHKDAEKVLFQSDFDCSALSTTGSLIQWQEEIAQYCVGNSRLLLSLCAAFAPPLLHLTGEENFGIHLVGPSSIGKTIALTVAGSVWGGGKLRGYGSRWRATVNGLEGLAYKHNDALLVLDELAEVSPYEAGNASYMLANGSGKVRGTKDGGMKEASEWRLVFLSAGEIDLVTHMQSIGEKTRAGQEVRMISIEADAGKGLGILEEVHRFLSSSELVDHLRAYSLKYYGMPIRRFMEQLVADSDIAQKFQQSLGRFKARFSDRSLHSQQGRVLHRFHLLAFAGELASTYGVLLDADIETIMASLYETWLSQYRGDSDLESHRILVQIRSFLQRYGVTHFPDLTDGSQVQKCYGFRKKNANGEFDWLIPSEIFREEICKGYEMKHVLGVLHQNGYIPFADSRSSRVERLPGLGRLRVYQISGDIMAD